MSWGGFLSWEGLIESKSQSPTSSFTPPAYGRQALACILQQEKPSILHLPYYLCDSVADAAHYTGTAIRWYALNQDFTPQVPELKHGEMLLLVNYFGLLNNKYIQDLADQYRDSLILDLTHHWFASPPENIWAFASTRKFFGVPDGSRIWIPKGKTLPLSAPYNQPEYRHLVERHQGNPDTAYALYSASEANISCTLQLQSPLTTAILNGLNFETIQISRKENFRLLASALHPYNQLTIPQELDSIPFHYPFLPKARLEHQALHRAGIFAPRLWAEVLTRNPEAYPFEKKLARNLLPLPIDQRYHQQDMKQMMDTLFGLMD